jgi:hypothetical protein
MSQQNVEIRNQRSGTFSRPSRTMTMPFGPFSTQRPSGIRSRGTGRPHTALKLLYGTGISGSTPGMSTNST